MILRQVGTYVRAWSLFENFEANVDGREWTQAAGSIPSFESRSSAGRCAADWRSASCERRLALGDKTSLEVCEARANSPLRRVGFFKPGDEVTYQAAKQAAFAPHDLVS